jgi:hypothetical protein
MWFRGRGFHEFQAQLIPEFLKCFLGLRGEFSDIAAGFAAEPLAHAANVVDGCLLCLWLGYLPHR